MMLQHHSLTAYGRNKATRLALGLVGLGMAANVYASAPLLWDTLDDSQKATILAGQPVRIDDPSPNYWQVTYYQWIHHDSPLADPRGAAAIFWDLPGQVSYAGETGLVAFDITAGAGTAAVKAMVTAIVPSPNGTQQIVYPQENSVFRFGSGTDLTYQSSWYSTDPAQPMAPGMVVTTSGDVRFQHFPGDGGGALLVYRMFASPIPALLGDAALREMFAVQVGAIVAKHVERMEQGPTWAQLLALEKALR